VAKAYGMTSLAEDTELAREAMYRALSKEGNPRLATLIKELNSARAELKIKCLDGLGI
jgi:probable addiction module antidote protein